MPEKKSSLFEEAFAEVREQHPELDLDDDPIMTDNEAGESINAVFAYHEEDEITTAKSIFDEIVEETESDSFKSK